MKRLLIIATLCVVLPQITAAQVEKQVEVTKKFVPSVERAEKLPIVPDMTDTTRMYPDIDYTITPLSIQTAFQLKPIRPATVTYWEFNRPLPFYLKVGAGYPLNSVLDFYATTQNPSIGYALGYVNHDGRYAKIRNDFGEKNAATQMKNRIGAVAGKYLGRHVLEGEVSYENRLYHRFGTYRNPAFEELTDPANGAVDLALATSRDAVDYGDGQISIRLGDEFQDLSRVNFEIALRGGLFFDHSDWPNYTNKARQTSLDVGGRIARAFGKHRIMANLGYRRFSGQKAIEGYLQQQIRAGVRYGREGDFLTFEVGADYYHDKIDGKEAENYFLPHAHLAFDLGTKKIWPFVEIDGRVTANDYRSLTRQNPYLQPASLIDKSSVDYDGRFGIEGALSRDRFSYRLYAAYTIHDHRVYWCGMGTYLPERSAYIEEATCFTPHTARQTAFSLHGEMEWRPITSLLLNMGLHGYIYDNESVYKSGDPSFRGDLAIRYTGKKFTLGVSALLQSAREWSMEDRRIFSTEIDESLPATAPVRSTFETPFSIDLRVNFEWKVSSTVGIFAEGRNLLNRRLYEIPWYPEYGIHFTAGVKLNF